MKIIFMGTPDFSVPILRGLIEAGYDVCAVVTQPDRPKGRKKILTPPPVKEEAIKHGIEVLQPPTLKNEERVNEIISRKPDLIVTAAYGQILPEKILSAPPFGAINVHASLLPKYRGGAPIHQAIIDGEKKTGVTIMYMVKELDAGDMLAQKEVVIEETDNVGTLHDKLSIVGKELLLETIPPLIKGEITPIPQDEQLVTYAPNIERGQEKIHWNKPGKDIYNQIRGLNPWPVAYTTHRGKVYKIWKGEKREGYSGHIPGEIIKIKETEIVVATGDETAIAMTEIQPAGKKKMPVADFLRGKHSFEQGDRLGDE
ncbi:methionyl-tRNA formyltransferase [Aliibacillus thermotolerans]|uniref:Methionyl-tRNA formyltransferase n=1 Tax=Aliibacillus thermotolerans TaxID=1834418 RepID=A0ABW0U3H5_9BACI|nr:methionyl-tRNA formyltransferase [Aliibacillus thermotolerans]MDA3130664.1 methionyl-tRNA formyltransferase [Aliibacillus thermotolerans]